MTQLRGVVTTGRQCDRGVLTGPIPDLPETQMLCEQFFERQTALARVHPGAQEGQVSARRRAVYEAKCVDQRGKRHSRDRR